jgi:hypothetical protein
MRFQQAVASKEESLLLPLVLQTKGLRRNNDAMENQSRYHKESLIISNQQFTGKEDK